MRATTNSGQHCRLFILESLIIILAVAGIIRAAPRPSEGKPIDITFFEHEHHRGPSYKISIAHNECINVKQGRTFSSMKIGDLAACVILFNADNCKQRPVKFKSGTAYGVDRFANVGANDDIASVKLCPESKS